MRALVTGGRSGIGAAIVAALGDADVTVLDLADGHDVGEPATWRALEGPFDAAFLNAGVAIGERGRRRRRATSSTGGSCASTSTASSSACASSPRG